MVTGAAAGLAHAAAACLTGTSQERVRALPDVSSITRHEIIMDGGSDLRWNQSIMLTGAKLVLVGDAANPMTAAALQRAITPRTAAVLWFSGFVDSEDTGFASVLSVCQSANIPVYRCTFDPLSSCR